jgi:hypothetical protein
LKRKTPFAGQVANHVDVTIEQNGGSISFTWKDYKFADFSDWINLFKPGQVRQ